MTHSSVIIIPSLNYGSELSKTLYQTRLAYTSPVKPRFIPCELTEGSTPQVLPFEGSFLTQPALWFQGNKYQGEDVPDKLLNWFYIFTLWGKTSKGFAEKLWSICSSQSFNTQCRHLRTQYIFACWFIVRESSSCLMQRCFKTVFFFFFVPQLLEKTNNMFEESDSAATKSPLHLAVSMRCVKCLIIIS